MAPTLDESTVTLSNMAAKIEAEFGIEMNPNTPYAWWRRNKVNDLPIPMPRPELWIGQRSPVWKWAAILAWYKAWKGLA
jgi:hypothetical protein